MTRLPAAALFDLDGVLIDTEGLYTDIWSEIEHAHHTGIDNFAIKIKGSTLKRILTTYYPDSDEQAEIIAMLNEREEKMLYTLFEGVEAFLADLKRHNIPTAIVTSSNAPKMERLFGMISGLRTAAARLGVAIEDCIVFEDSFSGLESGRAAGAHVVALATTNSRESLEGKADLIIDNFCGTGIEKLAGQL